MAKSGSKSVQVTSYNNLVFDWWEDHNSIAYNYTTIGWSLTLTSGEYGAIYSSQSRSWAVNVNGTPYEGSGTVAIGNNTSKVLASGYTQINHDIDGKKDFNYSFSQDFQITFSNVWIGTVSGSSSGTLDTIPRAATLLTAVDFTDEGNPTITYSNPAGSSVTSLQACISLLGTWADIAYRDISTSGTEYTFNLTEAERNVLRNATTTSNSRNVIFFVKTELGGQTYYSTLTKTLSIVNANPTLSPTVEDIGEVSISLTNSPTTKIIKDFNVLSYAFNATALKGASISSYSLTCGGFVVSTENSGRLEYVSSGNLVFTVTDSRGNATSKNVDFEVIPYVKPTCNISVENALSKDSETSFDAAISVSGNYFSGNFGAIDNELELKYRFKEANSEWNEWETLGLEGISYGEGTYSFSFDKLGLDYKKSYTVQCLAIDETGLTAYSVEYVVRFVPVFDWGENDFAFNVPVSIQGNPIADFVIEEGTDENWTYRKWASGEAECWGNFYYSFSATLPWGAGYISSEGGSSKVITHDFPSGLFIGSSAANVNLYQNGYLMTPMGGYWDANHIRYYIWLPTGAFENLSIWASIIVKGRWK